MFLIRTHSGVSAVAWVTEGFHCTQSTPL